MKNLRWTLFIYMLMVRSFYSPAQDTVKKDKPQRFLAGQLLTEGRKEFPVNLMQQAEKVNLAIEGLPGFKSLSNEYVKTSFFAGWAQYDVSGNISGIFGYDKDKFTKYWRLGRTPLISENNHFVLGGAWTGKEWHVTTVYMVSGKTYTGFRLAIDPISGETRKIGSGISGTTTGNIPHWSYNLKDNTIYGINYSNVLYTVSQVDTTATVIDTLRLGNIPLESKIRSFAINKEGQAYGITADGNLYIVYLTDGSVKLIGHTGIEMGMYHSSAAFELASGKLYYENSSDKGETLYEIDPLTAQTLSLGDIGIQISGMFNHFYSNAKDVPPGNIENLTYTVDNDQISFTWINPSKDYLGNLLADLTKVYIYRAEEGSDWKVCDSVCSPKIGQLSKWEKKESFGTVVRYKFYAVNSQQIFSSRGVEIEYGFYDYSLPWFTGFEETEGIPIRLKGNSAGKIAEIMNNFLYVYEGKHVLSLPPSTSASIVGIPVEKGATYLIEFMVRGYDTFANEFVYNPYGPLYLEVGDKTYEISAAQSKGWKSVNYIVPAFKTGRISLKFKSGSSDYYYLDNFKICMFTSSKAPETVENMMVIPGKKGKLTATVKWKNPLQDMSGSSLENLSGVIIDRCLDEYFIENVYTDTIETHEAGALVSTEMEMPVAGNWNFRFSTYNDHERSPKYVLLKSDWIGNDTILPAPRQVEVIPGKDRKLTLKWDALKNEGSHGGFLNGEVTGYVVVKTPNKGTKRDTLRITDPTCTFENLDMNLYSFTVYGVTNYITKGEAVTVNTIAGNTEKLITITNAEKALYSDYSPFNFYTAYYGGFSDKSSLNQLIISKDKFASPCIIDSLLFFIETSLKKETTQRYTIYLGSTEREAIGDKEDLIPISDLTQVFSGSLTIKKSDKLLVIPVKPFFYDGKKNLVLSIIRPKQKVTENVSFFANYLMSARLQGYITSVTDLPETGNLPEGEFFFSQYEPVMGANILTDMGTVKGKVVNINGKPLEGVKIDIESELEAKISLKYSVYTNKSGEYSFAYLPAGRYSLSYSYSANATETRVIESDGKSIVISDVTLYPSQRIKISGKVIDFSRKGIPGAKVEFLGNVKFETYTDENGRFICTEVYGSTEYTLKIICEDFEVFLKKIEAKESDLELQDIKINYLAYPIDQLETKMTKNDLLLKWQEPKHIVNPIEGKWCGKQKKLLGNSNLEVMAGITFEDSDLAKLGVDQLSKVCFYVGDETADYSLKVFSGENYANEIYSQPIGYLTNGWTEVFLRKPLKIKFGQGIRIAVHVKKGYKHLPFGYDEGPATEKGACLWKNGSWKLISDLGYYDGNWNIIAIFGEVVSHPAVNGYRVYRGVKGSEKDFDTWTLIAAGVTETVYKDIQWKDLTPNTYFYAVRSDYYEDNLSLPVLSSYLDKNMDCQVEIQLKGNVQRSGRVKAVFQSEENFYEKENENDDKIVLEKVRRGEYTVKAGKEGFETFIKENVAINCDTTFEININEGLKAPVLKNVKTEEKKISLEWVISEFRSFYDDMEAYEDWAIEGYGDYILTGTQEKCGLRMNGQPVLWPNQNTEQSFIVFNPSAATPPLMGESWQPHSGNKMLTAMFGAKMRNFDCLIKPVIKGGGILTFWVYGVTYDGKPETFRVLYCSEEEPEPTKFKVLHKQTLLENYAEWTKWRFELPEDATYFAINYTSDDIFALHIDDISYDQEFVLALPKGYEIWLDNKKVGEADKDIHQYTFETVSEGKHVVGVKAVYDSGVSEMVSASVNIGTSIENIDKEKGIYIYPNPSKGNFYVEGEWISACISDMYGRHIMDIPTSTMQIETTNLQPGIYMIQFTLPDKRVIVKKIILEK